MNQTQMNAQSTASETEAQEQALTLSRRKADILILIDIVTEKSRQVELITRNDLFTAFAEKAAVAPVPDAEELLLSAEKAVDLAVGRGEEGQTSVVQFRSKKEMREHADDVPTTRAQREVFSRREALRNLLAGNVAAAVEDVKASEAGVPVAQKAEPREITREYFDSVTAEALEGDYGFAHLISWDNVEYFHYRPLLSGSYARFLSTQGDPAQMLCDAVRESSRVYPRPIVLGAFQEPPYNLTPEVLQELMHTLPSNPETRDIRYTETSIGTIYLYSDKYLEDDYADFLAEHLDVDVVMSP